MKSTLALKSLITLLLISTMVFIQSFVFASNHKDFPIAKSLDVVHYTISYTKTFTSGNCTYTYGVTLDIAIDTDKNQVVSVDFVVDLGTKRCTENTGGGVTIVNRSFTSDESGIEDFTVESNDSSWNEIILANKATIINELNSEISDLLER